MEAQRSGFHLGRKKEQKSNHPEVQSNGFGVKLPFFAALRIQFQAPWVRGIFILIHFAPCKLSFSIHFPL